MKIKTTETFSYKVKSESRESITGRKKSDACLMGYLLVSQADKSGGIRFVTDSDVCSDLFVRLVSHAAENENVAVMTVLRSRGRAPQYSIAIENRQDVYKISQRLGFSVSDKNLLMASAEKISEKNYGAFAAGVFMACGSISSPDKEYHLEFIFQDDSVCGWFCRSMMDRFAIPLRQTKRNGSFVLYLKGSEGIEDVLTLIGAQMSSLELMNVKVYKDFRNRANRATNCDTANCERQNRCAARQIEAIKRIEASEGGLSRLDDDLREIAELRLKYPEYNLSELSAEVVKPISKSGGNHRLKRIEEIAEEINKQQ